MKKILIIEDDDSIRESTEEVLRQEGFRVFTANDGLKGIETAIELLPDIIICDIMMPHLDGYGVIKKLRENIGTSTIPLIFLTAKIEKMDIRKGMELGADDYLIKPFTINELLNSINIRLEKNEHFKQKSEKDLEDLRVSIGLSLPHELNTPLTGIIGFAELLHAEYETLKKEEIFEMTAYICDSAKRMKSTIERILLYSKLQLLSYSSNELSYLSEVKMKINERCIETILFPTGRIRHRDNDVQIKVEESFILIPLEYFKIILMEIADNAFKFSEPLQNVKFQSFIENNIYYLVIEDEGRGISRGQLEKIGAFMQFDRIQFEQQGSGLGLVISRLISQLFSATFAIESEYGVGTRVTIGFLTVDN